MQTGASKRPGPEPDAEADAGNGRHLNCTARPADLTTLPLSPRTRTPLYHHEELSCSLALQFQLQLLLLPAATAFNLREISIRG